MFLRTPGNKRSEDHTGNLASLHRERCGEIYMLVFALKELMCRSHCWCRPRYKNYPLNPLWQALTCRSWVCALLLLIIS